MPPLNLGSLLRRGGDGCGGELEETRETAFSSSDSDGGCGEECSDVVDGDGDPYSPAESLWLRIGEDIDWSDVGAVLEREDSTKGASNPKSLLATWNSSAAPAAAAARTSSCAAGSMTPKNAVAVVVIAGLPAAAGKISREQGRRRRRRIGRARSGARVFSGEAGEAGEAEPGSPKVSCLGGVRSRQPCPDGAAGRRRWLPCFVSVACRRCWNPRG